MATAEVRDLDEEDRRSRPSKAVVGSPREEKEVFCKAYDPKIVRRIWAFVRPYRSKILISVFAVLTFTLTQLAIPLIIRYAIDNGMARGADGHVLLWCIAVFAAMIVINYVASYVQESVVGRV